MLLDLTALLAFAGTIGSFWLAAYLVARGFPSRVTLRAAIVMAVLGLYFFSAYVNTVAPDPRSTWQRAALLVWALAVWFDLTLQLIPPAARGRRALGAAGAYGLAVAATALLLLRPDTVWALTNTGVGAAPVPLTVPFVALGVFHAGLMAATLYNFKLIQQSGGGAHLRYFFGATALGALTVAGYYGVALSGMPGIPTAVQSSLLLLAVGLFGYAVARYQALIERHTTLQDFPISGLVVMGLAVVYALLAQQRGFARGEVAGIATLAVLTHSGVDLAREFLDRLLHQDDARLRQQLRRLGRSLGGNRELEPVLRRGLGVVCHRLQAGGAFVALPRAGQWQVASSLRSLPVGAEVAAAVGDEVTRAGPGMAAEWLAPVRAGAELVAVVGLGAPRSARYRYTEPDLDVLAETADWVGVMVAHDQQQRQARERLGTLAAEAQTLAVGLQAGPEDLLTALSESPAPEFVRLVEDALRHLADYAFLGESPLAEHLKVSGATHIERGKALRERLTQALEALRPAAQRPAEPLPREWYSYVVLADAYLDDVPNREIMARLYVSQGTFNRARRKALHAVARNLLEMAVPSQA